MHSKRTTPNPTVFCPWISVSVDDASATVFFYNLRVLFQDRKDKVIKMRLSTDA